jgi:rhamnosyltransferase subunit B
LVLAQPQPDWSRNTIVTGFTFYDGDQNMVKLAPELQQFLKTGEAPIVFTLVSVDRKLFSVDGIVLVSGFP